MKTQNQNKGSIANRAAFKQADNMQSVANETKYCIPIIL